MPDISTNRQSNQLLAALSAADMARLNPHLTRVNLKLLQKLEKPNKPIDYIYFMHAGIASVVAVQSDETRVEIGLVGREGMTGSPVVLGDSQSPHSTYIQAVGAGDRIAATELRAAARDSETLHRLLLKYVQSFMVQTAHTAIANARAKLPERLARWILMAQDRVDGDVLPLTHDFLALMLGVRRAGVTEALHDLQRRRLIQTKRGFVLVLDRAGLERKAGDFYGGPEQEYRRLIGPARA
ncbi:MAG TPA: Crp/Fnr family transcriptional regulator [Pseudolabrys sp.]|jgi:CRP-like cAMP-binding protein